MGLDSISLTAMILMLGIIVDDGIIISENIYRHWEHGDSPLTAAVEGIREVFFPVLTTILTTLLVFAPMFLMPGMMGKFIFTIPLVVSLALLVSLVEVTIALPAHLSRGLHRHKEGEERVAGHPWFEHLKEHYQHLVPHVLRFRYAFILLAVVVLVGTLWYAGAFMKFVLFPPGMADQFFVMTELPRGTPLHTTSDKVRNIEALISNLPEGELESFTTRVGIKREVDGGESERENHAYLSVNLTPFSTRDRTADEIVEVLRRKTDGFTGFTNIVYTIESGGPPVGKPITIRIVGSGDAMRTELANAVEEFLWP